MSLSGWLALKDEPLFSEANKQTPLLMCHGTSDPVVQYEYGVGSHKLLEAAGANVTFKSYQWMGHTVMPQELSDVKAFLKKCLPQ